jgi:hypothetical protein
MTTSMLETLYPAVLQKVAPALQAALPGVVQGGRVDSGTRVELTASAPGVRLQGGSGSRAGGLGGRSIRFVWKISHLRGNGVEGLVSREGHDNQTRSVGVWSWYVYSRALGGTGVEPKTFESRGL